MKETFKTLSSLIFFIHFLAVSIHAQSVIFKTYKHNFGRIAEENGPITFSFSFENEGKKPIQLLQVEASCGCTTPDWSKGPINPKEKGYITATFDPEGQAGKVQKAITVHTDSEPELIVLQLIGEVIPAPPGLEDHYPWKTGSLRLRSSSFSFGEVWHNATASGSFSVYNESPNPITLLLKESSLPSSLTFKTETVTVPATDSIKVEAILLADSLQDWGYVYDYFTLKTTDTFEPEKRLHYSVRIKEKFADNAINLPRPILTTDKIEHDFGTVKSTSFFSTVFIIKNTGEKELILRKVHSPCGCTVSEPAENVLLPGESTQLKVTYSPRNTEGLQRKSINLISNDPANPEINLWIKAFVKD